jgi:hypothetical protein
MKEMRFQSASPALRSAKLCLTSEFNPLAATKLAAVQTHKLAEAPCVNNAAARQTQRQQIALRA